MWNVQDTFRARPPAAQALLYNGFPLMMLAINIGWNILMVACCVRRAKICCFGPTACTSAIHAAINKYELSLIHI